MSYLIRPEIVAKYHLEAEQAWATRHAMIATRDDQYRALNAEFGCLEANGSASSSYMGKAGPEYHARYRAIDDIFKPKYDMVSIRQEEWRKTLALTLSEFLFLDNFSGSLLRQLCAEPRFADSFRSDLLRRKAAIYIEDWKIKESVGGIYARIEMENANFPYAAKRCRIFFEIGSLNFSAANTIKHFRDEWKNALFEAINRQRID